MPPLVPVIVKGYVCAAIFLLVSTVSTEVPEFTTDGGLNVMLLDLGVPVTDNVTVPEKPATAAMVTVYVVAPPLRTVLLVGVAEIVKSPLTTSVTLAV